MAGTRQVNDRRRREEERYEAMPDLARLPGWLWRRTPTWGRVTLALLPFVAIALVLLLGPGVEAAKERSERVEEQRIARERAERIAAIRRAQRPRFASTTPGAATVPERLRALDDVERAILRDARERVAAGDLRGPIRRVTCEPFPRNVEGIGAERDLSLRHGNYSCLAVTAEFGSSGAPGEPWGASERGLIGHPYRTRIDFESGRFAYCKVSGRPAEGSLEAELKVTVPRVCGGR